MKFILFLFSSLILIFSDGSYGVEKNISSRYDLSEGDKEFLDTLQYRSFLYFWHETNPKNGLVKDRSTEKSPSSIAAVGFAIPIWAIGADHNWIAREDAVNRTLTVIKFFWNSPQSPESHGMTGFQGFFYHFLDMKTGKRFKNSELSTIDTALLLAGIRFARQYYDGDNPQETKIRNLADSITYRVNWDFSYISDSKSNSKGTVSMAWRPEKGLSSHGWRGYNEALILYILAAGSGYSHFEESYNKWLNSYEWDEPYGFAHVIFPPLFGHQYSHMFVDFRGIYDDYMKENGIDYFENSRRAVYVQRQYAIDNPMNWAGYDSLTWGLTACDGPGPSYNKNGMKFRKYSARGTSGPNHIHNDDGTIAPTAAGGSIVFAPEIVIPTLRQMYEEYGSKGLWGKYGFLDAFNPTLNWYDDDYLGIDQGPIVIMIENFRNGFVWKYMMEDPVIQKGLKKLGFTKLN